MIRLILVAVYLILFFFVGIFLNILVYFVKKKDAEKALRISTGIVRTAFKQVLFICGVKVIVSGEENAPDHAALYIGNHRSYFDILSAHTTVGFPMGFVAKAEMLKIPFLRTWMVNIGCMFLDRKDARAGMKMMLEAAERIKGGSQSIVIYPEGTRGHGEDVAEFKHGSFKIAQKAGCEIVPVAVVGTDRIFELNPWFWKVRGRKVYIRYGKPVATKEMSKEEFKAVPEQVRDSIIEMRNDMKKEYQLDFD